MAVVLLLLALTGCGDGDDPGATPTEADTMTAAPAPSPEATATAVPEVSHESYTVQSGDTLSGIARRFGTTVQAIVEVNELDDPDIIHVGEELVIPTPADGT